jgi:hypothetical protein
MRVVRRTQDSSFLYTTKTPNLSTRPFKYSVPCVYDCGPLWVHRRCSMLQHSTDPAAVGTISAKSFASELHPERTPTPLINSYTITPLKACSLIVSRTIPVCKTEYLETWNGPTHLRLLDEVSIQVHRMQTNMRPRPTSCPCRCSDSRHRYVPQVWLCTIRK